MAVQMSHRTCQSVQRGCLCRYACTEEPHPPNQFYSEAKIPQFFRVATAAETSMMAALWQIVQVQARHVKLAGHALCKK